MRNTFLIFAASVGLLLAPAVALAAPTDASVHYSTAMTQLYGAPAPYTGTLDITINGGILHGYYFPSDYSSLFVAVVGGQTGDRIWLDIGTAQPLRVDARVKSGVIVGTAFTDANDPYTFVAKPISQPAR